MELTRAVQCFVVIWTSIVAGHTATLDGAWLYCFTVCRTIRTRTVTSDPLVRTSRTSW